MNNKSLEASRQRSQALWLPLGVMAWVVVASLAECAGAAEPLPIGTQRLLLVDDFLIDKLDGTSLELQHPETREVVLVHDAPWEGNTSTYHTVFQDGDLYRMYYRGSHYDLETRKQRPEEVFCYAESRDGIHWTKPDLDLFAFEGSTQNNIVLMGLGTHNLAPFKDQNPACPPESRYKAVGGGKGGLIAFHSADGIRWSPMRDKPVITDGAFDSLNIAYWDSYRGQYVAFFRDFRSGVRDIKTCTSDDFLTWSEPQWLHYEGAPTQHLYTNAIVSYDRAPHLFVGFPKRFHTSRNPLRHPAGGVSDCGFMTSRDGMHFHRWNEALIRPGRHPDRWVNRNNLAAWGLVVTQPELSGGPEELSIYTTEGYYRGTSVRLRRHTFRLDGFASANAGGEQGEMLTKPLMLSEQAAAGALQVNFATSALGSIRVEVQDVDGTPIAGFELENCDELFGDQTAATVSWQGQAHWKDLANKPVRLRFVMQDADIFALHFNPSP